MHDLQIKLPELCVYLDYALIILLDGVSAAINLFESAKQRAFATICASPTTPSIVLLKLHIDSLPG
jgi:hypothetical protein